MKDLILVPSPPSVIGQDSAMSVKFVPQSAHPAGLGTSAAVSIVPPQSSPPPASTARPITTKIPLVRWDYGGINE